MVDLKKTQRGVMVAKTETRDIPIYLSTGVTVLDLVVGGGETAGWGMGYKAGSIVRDWGDSSSSKSFKVCQMIAANKYRFKDKFKYCYLDLERGNNINTVKLYGFDIFAESWKPPIEVRTAEDWYYVVVKFLESMKPDEVGVVILDSLDALSDKATEERKEERIKLAEKGKDLDKGSYAMTKQKFLSDEMFKGLQSDCDKKKVLLYIISQARDNVGAMTGPKLRVNGGNAIRFAESVRIQSRALAKDVKNSVPVSVQVTVRAEKMRHDKPFRTCQFPVVFDYGLDDIGASVDYLYDLRSDVGNLLARAEAVSWGSGEPVTDSSLEDFLEKNAVFEECRSDLGRRFNPKQIKAWIEKRPELQERFEERFGKTMTRDELISYIEVNHFFKELRGRVIAKWDAFETSIATNRPKQFSYMEE